MGRNKKLADVHNSASDVASDEVGVHRFKIGGRKHAAGHNAVAESGSEPLDLVLQSAQHVCVRSVGNMAISPGGVFASWGSRRIEQARLRQQNKWTIRVPSISNCLLRGSDLLKTSAQVYRRCAQAIGSFPRNWRVQSVVHFEYAGPVAVSLQAMLVMIRQPLSSKFEKLSRGHVTENQVIVWQRGQRLNCAKMSLPCFRMLPDIGTARL